MRARSLDLFDEFARFGGDVLGRRTNTPATVGKSLRIPELQRPFALFDNRGPGCGIGPGVVCFLGVPIREWLPASGILLRVAVVVHHGLGSGSRIRERVIKDAGVKSCCATDSIERRRAAVMIINISGMLRQVLSRARKRVWIREVNRTQQPLGNSFTLRNDSGAAGWF